VVGDLGASEVQRLLDARLAGWREQPGLPPPTPTATLEAAVPAPDLLLLVSAEPGPAWVALGAGGSGEAEADAAATWVTGELLVRRLEDQAGLERVAGPGSGTPPPLTRPWSAVARVAPDQVAPLLASATLQAGHLSAGALQPGELEAARAALLGRLPIELERGPSVASALAAAALRGQPPDALQRWAQRLAEVTPSAVATAARRSFPQGSVATVVGPAALEVPLRALGRAALVVEPAWTLSGG
jgi:predicted Zn-dependent peptidase